MEHEGRLLPVKLTVKEYLQEGTGRRIYSVEAINVGL